MLMVISVATSLKAIDHPIEPFQEFKVLAITEGEFTREPDGQKIYSLFLYGWGTISFNETKDIIMAMKVTRVENDEVMDCISLAYHGEYRKYALSRTINRIRQKFQTIDWSIAWELASTWLNETKKIKKQGLK
jgi:hypothetical protein